MKTRILYAVTLAAALSACSSVPERNSALDDARVRLSAAQNDPQVTKLAPDELKYATESLRLADKARNEGEATTTVNHLAYMTAQHVVIAQETASSRAAQAIVAGAAADRDRMRLALRTEEADAAKRQLTLSEESNARKSAELARADAAAERDQARVERRDARVNDLEMQLRDLNAKQTERGLVVTLGDVLFNSGQARLLPGAAHNMARLADVFKSDPQRSASIEGHTDSVGGADANQDLSLRRADAVMTALVSLGVPADRLSTRGYGEDSPAASNDSAAGRQMNRRVEIVFVQPGANIYAK
jgi:outer membrane protein OmpA-like peptidoglycan-associated protein